MLAQCSASSISIGGSDVKVTKNVIGLVVVFFDLLITFLFWCMMLGLKEIQTTVKAEIFADTCYPQDFTVVISQKPHLESLDELKGVYYAWVENVCAQEPEEMIPGQLYQVDENQNNVWNVNLGLTNMGYLQYMQQMGKLLV